MTSTAQFPVTTNVQGETYGRTEKYGTRIATGEHAAEYESVTRNGWRVWMTAAGEVYPD